MYRCLVIVARKLIKVKIKHFALTINSRLKCRFSAVFSSDGVMVLAVLMVLMVLIVLMVLALAQKRAF